MKTSDRTRPLLDAIGEIEDENGCPRITARRLVAEDEPFFAGHFPAMPVVPGVFVVEALAECARRLLERRGAGAAATLAGAPSVRFRRRILPGDSLELTVARTVSEGCRHRFRALASVNGRPAVEATLEVVVAPGAAMAQTAGK